MSGLERFLESGSTELPDCRCGSLMRIASNDAAASHVEGHIRVYRCDDCNHELRLMVWDAATVQ